MMRSTSSETNWLAIVAQLGWSPAPFWTVMLTLSPSSSVSLSQKPLVARSSAGCCTSCTTPTLKTLSAAGASAAGAAAESAGAAEEAGALWPQAHSIKIIHSAQIRARIFFIFVFLQTVFLPGQKENRTVICAACRLSVRSATVPLQHKRPLFLLEIAVIAVCISKASLFHLYDLRGRWPYFSTMWC